MNFHFALRPGQRLLHRLALQSKACSRMRPRSAQGDRGGSMFYVFVLCLLLAPAPLRPGTSRRLGFDLGDAYGELNALAVDLPRLGLHLAKALSVAVGTLGAPLGCRVQGPVEPPPLPLDLSLKGTQRLKGVGFFAIAGHISSLVLFPLCCAFVPFLFPSTPSRSLLQPFLGQMVDGRR